MTVISRKNDCKCLTTRNFFEIISEGVSDTINTDPRFRDAKFAVKVRLCIDFSLEELAHA